MLSKLTRVARPAATLVRLTARPTGARPLVAALHTATAALQEAGALNIDKSNPLYAPDAWDEWMNTGYSNLAPKDHRSWSDLPAPYKYYDVKVDPADVEAKGFLWSIFTDWRTALPATGLLALPMYLYDVFVLDERVMLALITWFTFALIRTQAGPGLGASLKQGAIDEAQELYDVESAYRTALAETATAHKNVLDLVSDLQSKHAADRALKALEAQAMSREVRVEQATKMKAMLDYMVMAKAETVASAQDSVLESSFDFVANQLQSDSKFQQQSINDALDALAGKKDFKDMAVVTSFFDKMSSTVDEMTAAGVPADALARQREMFSKKFGFADTVSQTMLDNAKANPKEWAALVAKCGGATPTVGTPITYKMPIDC